MNKKLILTQLKKDFTELKNTINNSKDVNNSFYDFMLPIFSNKKSDTHHKIRIPIDVIGLLEAPNEYKDIEVDSLKNSTTQVAQAILYEVCNTMFLTAFHQILYMLDSNKIDFTNEDIFSIDEFIDKITKQQDKFFIVNQNTLLNLVPDGSLNTYVQNSLKNVIFNHNVQDGIVLSIDKPIGNLKKTIKESDLILDEDQIFVITNVYLSKSTNVDIFKLTSVIAES